MVQTAPHHQPLNRAVRVGLAFVMWGLIYLNSCDVTEFWRGFCERTVPLALLGLTILTTAGCGGRLLVWLEGPYATRRNIEFFCLSSALGWAVLSVLLCGVASVGQFDVGVFVPLAIVASISFGFGLDGGRSGWDMIREVRWARWAAIYRLDPWLLAAGFFTFTIIGITFLWAWGPVWDYDAEMYHLPNSANLLRQHGLAANREEPLANLPGQAYLWFALGLAAGSEAYSALLVCWAAVMTSLLAASLASRWFGMHAALWTLPVYWSGLIVHAVASTPRVEPLYSLMFLAVIAWLIEAWRQRDLRWSTVVCCGLGLGTAGAVKYQGLYGWLIVGVWWAWLWCSNHRWRTGRVVLHLICLFAIGFVVMAPWWWQNFQTFHNPIYPMFDRSQIDPDSLRHSNPHGPHHRSHDWNYLIVDTWDLFTKPDTFSGPPNQWPHYPFLLLPLLMVVWPWSQRSSSSHPSLRATLLTLVWISAGYHALSLRLTHESRHLFAVFSLGSMLCGYVVAEFRVRWGLKVILPAVVVLLMAVVPMHPSRLVRLSGYLQYSCGLTSGRGLRARVLPPDYDRAIDWCNHHTPADAVILMCWESRRYRLQRTAIADSGGSTWTTLFRNRETAAEISKYLHDQGVDYVLVNEASLEFNTNRSRLIPQQIRTDFRRQRLLLTPDVLEPVFGSRQDSPKAITVYRVR